MVDAAAAKMMIRIMITREVLMITNLKAAHASEEFRVEAKAHVAVKTRAEARAPLAFQVHVVLQAPAVHQVQEALQVPVKDSVHKLDKMEDLVLLRWIRNNCAKLQAKEEELRTKEEQLMNLLLKKQEMQLIKEKAPVEEENEK